MLVLYSAKHRRCYSEHPVLNSEIANAIHDAISSHVNNKLEFIGQNMHDMFDDRFSRIEIHLGMKSVGNNASTSNTDNEIDRVPERVTRLSVSS